MSDEWKCYEPLPEIAVFDASSLSTCRVADLVITAKVAGAELDKPIGLVIDGVCSLAFGIEQLDVLMARLAQARADVVSGIVARRAGGLPQ